MKCAFSISETVFRLFNAYFFIHSLWVYAMALLVNLFALYCGSSTAYALVISAQFVWIALLNLMDLLVRHSDGKLIYKNALIWNPAAHLVLGWHSSNMEDADQALESAYMQTEM